MKYFLKIKHPFLTLALLYIGCTCNAQMDPHFSQYYNQPMAMNPALTGAIEGDYRISSIFRSQYGNALQTKGLSGEVVTEKNSNFGLNILNETTTDEAYNYTTGYLSYAYTGVHFGHNNDKQIVLAMQGGFLQRHFDVTKLQFGDQWISGTGYSPVAGTREAMLHNSAISFDAGLGAAYFDRVPDKKVNYFGGISVFHINNPTTPFLSGTADALPIRYCAQGGARINANDLLSFVPSIIYMKEGDFSETVLGAYVQLNAGENTDFIAGTNLRFGDAVIPFTGMYYKGLTVGISYDASISHLAAAGAHTGGLEVSISFVGFGKSNIHPKPFYCPRF